MRSPTHSPEYEFPTKEPNRCTGRTFRAILSALALASEGKKVLFYAHNRHMALYSLGRAEDLCCVCGVNRVTEFHYTPLKITFANGGEIKFTYDSLKKNIGLSGYITILDNE